MKITTMICIVVLFFGCKSIEGKAMEFCPENIEDEARVTLGIVDLESVKIRILLNTAASLGLTYESYEIDNSPLNCKSYKKNDGQVFYMIYGGFNEDRTYKKAYLIIANSADGDVLYIDKRYMYKVPKPF